MNGNPVRFIEDHRPAPNRSVALQCRSLNRVTHSSHRHHGALHPGLFHWLWKPLSLLSR